MRGKQVTQRIESESETFARKLRLLALPLAVVAFLALFTAPAFGALTHPLKATFGAFAGPAGIAIDEANGNVLVADGGSSDSVEILGPEGGAPSGVTVNKIEGFNFNDRPDLAIDNSATSPSKGALYVVEGGHEIESGENAVTKFTLNSVSEEYEPKGALNATPAFGQPLGVAVDAKGNVFVSDRPHNSAEGFIVEFSSTGVEIGRIHLSEASSTLKTGTNALAFDSAGNLYAQSNWGQGVWKFAANGSGEIEPSTVPTRIIGSGSTGIAVDQDTDTIYAAMGKSIAQYSASCLPVSTPDGAQCDPEREFGAGILSSTLGIAASPINGDIYVADGGKGDVALFAAGLAIVPDASTEAPSAVKQSAATLNGTVSAAGGPQASCEFQYTTKASFQAEEFDGASTAPCSPPGPFIGSSTEPVKADISGLSAETAYVFRLAASNENGFNFGEALSFGTVGKPKIEASFISLVTLDSAKVEGLVNPNGGPGAAVVTTYTVEYVSEEDFEASGYATATKLPPGGEAIGSGTKGVKVAQQLSGLSVGATYHYRIIAENEAGEEIGPDKTFTTYPEAPTGLPDARAYEQVTPLDKNGAAPAGSTFTVQAALDGDGIVYASGGGIPGSVGAQQYPLYLAARATDWSTQGLLPPASNGASAAVLGWGEELEQAYDTQAILVGSPASFLERDSATGALRAIVAEEGGLDITLTAFVYVGASADGSVVAFESNTPLYPGGSSASGAYNTYAWDRESGELRLAGALNTGLAPAKGTLAGSNEEKRHTHYTQAQQTLSADGRRLFFSDAASGQLFMRQNPAQPQSELSAGACTEPALACTTQVSASQKAVPDPKGPKPATFWAATPDGSKAFFTSPAKLTEDATTGPNDEGNDLYRYDAESEELLDLAPDLSDSKGADVQGVLGISDDGSYVYFAANGKFDTAPSTGDCSGGSDLNGGSGACNLYLWHSGAITFIARMLRQSPSDSTNWVSAAAPSQVLGNTARVTPDGQTLLFRSKNQLDAYDNQGTPEFYRYRVGDPQPQCVSCNPTGAAPVGAPTPQSIQTRETTPSPAAIMTRNLSADGDRVFFETPDKLVASDVNGVKDVYEWEAEGSGSCTGDDQNDGCLYLLSTGTSPEPSYFADADEEGDNAFLYTTDSLVKQDKDQIVDIYDARIGGGIASQNPSPSPPPCEGEACKGSASTPPATESAGTSGFSGLGNSPACKKGKVRKRGRCVKRTQSHKRKHRAKRHAGGKRG